MIIKDIQENYGTGWISLYRSIKNHWVWDNPVYLKIWIDFLFRANHQDNKIPINADLILIKRGSFITSLKKLALEYKCSIGKIRHFLEILEKDLMIELITTQKYTQITICNYNDYQDAQHTERNQNEIKMKSKRKQNETNNNDNNVNNDNKKTEDIVNEEDKVKKEYFLDLLPIDSTQQFISAWTEWVDFRREIKKKLTKSTANKQIGFLNKQKNPIECINQSIEKGWTGLFEIAGKDKFAKPNVFNPNPMKSKKCQAPNCDKDAILWSDGVAGCCYAHILDAKKKLVYQK